MKELTSNFVEAKGKSYFQFGKTATKIGFYGICVLLLHCLVTLLAWEFDFSEVVALLGFNVSYSFEYVLLVLEYLSIVIGAIGLWWYHYGLQIYALGRITVNTEKEVKNKSENDIKTSNTSEEQFELK